ncbi:hypothetical protein V6O07_01910 [Arthrospira platensis SPKY2]
MNSEISTNTISVYELKEYNFDFGLNDYPIWDEAYRPILNNAILEWYMFREIGYVNPNVWRQRLRNRMDIIMRNKYNALYSAKAKEFNPLYTMELYEDYTHTVTNTNTGEVNYTANSSSTNTSKVTSEQDTETNSNGLGLSSQFPSEEMTEDDLTNNLFVDNANKNTGKETTNDSLEQSTTANGTNSATDKTTNIGNNTTTESYNKKTYGSASDLSFAHAMTQFKDYCDQFQLDQQVIEELKDLFMQVW